MAVSEASGHGVEGRTARPEPVNGRTSGSLLTAVSSDAKWRPDQNVTSVLKSPLNLCSLGVPFLSVLVPSLPASLTE